VALLNNIGDGIVLVYALVVSILVAVLTWRRIGFIATVAATMAVAVALAIVQSFVLGPNEPVRQIVYASFIVVPSALLLGASRVSWLARHAWLFVLFGPIVFVACIDGICKACIHLKLI
jgi:O-antigen ligase